MGASTGGSGGGSAGKGGGGMPQMGMPFAQTPMAGKAGSASISKAMAPKLNPMMTQGVGLQPQTQMLDAAAIPGKEAAQTPIANAIIPKAPMMGQSMSGQQPMQAGMPPAPKQPDTIQQMLSPGHAMNPMEKINSMMNDIVSKGSDTVKNIFNGQWKDTIGKEFMNTTRDQGILGGSIANPAHSANTGIGTISQNDQNIIANNMVDPNQVAEQALRSNIPSAGMQNTAAATPQSVANGISDVGVNFIKQQEGFTPKASWDYKQTSVGYGSKGKPGEVISKEEAHSRLLAETDKIIPKIQQNVKVPLTQNQLDALTSFSYNVGTGWMKNSNVIRKLNAGDYAGAAKSMASWNKAGGKVLPGLVKRRNSEIALFNGDIPDAI